MVTPELITGAISILREVDALRGFTARKRSIGSTGSGSMKGLTTGPSLNLSTSTKRRSTPFGGGSACTELRADRRF